MKNYSSGMYVRLGFSVAINVDPDILLVDEVLAVGDIEFQRRCLEKLVELKARGKTIVLVSHSLDSVRNLCDTAALLEGGRLRRLGPTTEVIDEYIGDTHPDRVADGEFGARWGSGEGTIDRVELLDADGTPARRVRTGDPVTFRLHYSTSRSLAQPVFGIALYHIDGVYLCGPNTRDAGLVPDRIDGSGVVDLRVDRLLLLPGTYDLGGTLCDSTLTHVYDQRHRVFRFDVEHGEPREEFGLVSLGGVWEGAAFDRALPASERRSAS